MQNYLSTLMIICCVLGALNCTQSNKPFTEKKKKYIELDSLYSFQLESTEIVSRIDDHHGIKADSKGEWFLFADRGKNQVLVTDSLGNVKVIVGGSGRGPTEFLSINGLAFINKDSFLVYDESLALIKMFEVGGGLIGSFKPSMDGYYFSSPDIVVNKSVIYAGILESDYVHFIQSQDFEKMAQSKIITAIDTSGNDMGKYGSYDKLTPESKDYVQFSIVGFSNNWNKVLVNQLDSPIIQYYDIDTGTFGVFSEQVPKNYVRATEFISVNNSKNRVREMSLGRTYAERLVPLENHLFKSMDKLTEEWNITRDPMTKTNILIVYDKNGNIVAEKVLEGKRLFGGHGNKLYFLTDNNPDNFTIQVATYRLVDK